jgi:sirohydrochlorin ferrochelatase
LNALILLSHGSRRQESNAEMIRLAEAVAAVEGQPYNHVTCAFQQFARPAFDQAVEESVSRGVSRIVVYPLFLAAGSHVQEDVPAMIRRARSRFPDLDIILTPHLGQTPGLAQFLVRRTETYA